MLCNQLDLIVRDVPAAAAFFCNILNLTPRVSEERFAEFAVGPLTILLSPDAMVPTKPARGTILHFEVEDVSTALEQARSQGATILLEPTRTDWGTESAMIAGPEEIAIDFYRTDIG